MGHSPKDIILSIQRVACDVTKIFKRVGEFEKALKLLNKNTKSRQRYCVICRNTKRLYPIFAHGLGFVNPIWVCCADCQDIYIERMKKEKNPLHLK